MRRAVISLTLLLTACASPIPTCQCVRVYEKSAFVGPVSYRIELETGESSAARSVWWAHDESLIVAFDGEHGPPSLAFRIDDHLAVERTGEESGCCSTDLRELSGFVPWNERDFMRIDWSQELSASTVERLVGAPVEPIPFFPEAHDEAGMRIEERDASGRLRRLEVQTYYWRADREEEVLARHILTWP